MQIPQKKIADILENANIYHTEFYEHETFSGPSLHFHRRALEYISSEDWERYLEYIYATLTSWGMHRMGGGPKMQPFDVFATSLNLLKADVLHARQFEYENTNGLVLEKIFKGIDVMASRTRLVGNSKVMAHLMPNIVPPVDREYTLYYLKGNKNITNDSDHEWNLLKTLIKDFFIPIASNPCFKQLAYSWMNNHEKYPWDTSMFKIIDNLIISAVKSKSSNSQLRKQSMPTAAGQ